VPQKSPIGEEGPADLGSGQAGLTRDFTGVPHQAGGKRDFRPNMKGGGEASEIFILMQCRGNVKMRFRYCLPSYKTLNCWPVG
jgi:hypothetical protein